MRKPLLSLALAPLILVNCVSNNPNNIPITPLPQRPSRPELMTSAHYTLELERPFGANEQDFKKVDIFLRNLERKIRVRDIYSYPELAYILDSIAEETKKIFPNYEMGQTFFFSLRTGKADCDRLAILYMSAAERFNLPMKAVYAKGFKKVVSGVETNLDSHVFVRWMYQEPMQGWENWECTLGKPVSDEYYKKYPSLKVIENFKEWCLDERMLWYKLEYGTNYLPMHDRAEELRKNLK